MATVEAATAATGNGGAVGGDVDSGGGGGIASSGNRKSGREDRSECGAHEHSTREDAEPTIVLQASTHERGILSGRRSSRGTARSYEGGVI